MTSTVTQLLDQIASRGNLTSENSRQAIAKARKIWSSYTDKPNHLRDLNAPRDVAKELDLVLAQIANKVTHIAPNQWRPFCQLYNTIKDAVRTGQILEPMIEPANDNPMTAIDSDLDGLDNKERVA